MAKRVIIKELVTKMAFQVDARSLSNAEKRMRDVAKHMKDLRTLTSKPIVIKVDHKQVKAAAKELLNLKKRMQETIKLASRSVNFKVSVSGMAQLNALAAAAQRARASGGAIRYSASGGGGGRRGSGGSDTVGATLGRINPNRGSGGGGGGAYASANAYARGGSVLDVAGGNMLSGAVVGAGGAANSAVRYALDSLGQQQTAMTQLTTLVGKDKAGSVLKSLQDFAANTPYELNETVQMFTRLEGAGFKLIDKFGKVDYSFMTRVGDLAASSNKSLSHATDMMLSLKRGLGSMVDNFVGLGSSATGNGQKATMYDRTTGKETAFDIKSGDAMAVKKFISQAGSRKGISGGMEALSKTLPGQISRFWDEVSMASNKFMGAFAKDISNFMNRITNDLSKMGEKAGRWGVQAKQSLRELMDIAKFLEPVFKGLGIAAGIMVANFVGGKVYAFAAAIYAMDGAMIKARLSAIALNLALTGGILLAMDFIQFFVTGDSQLLKFTERWPWLHDAIKRVYEFGKVFFIALGMGFQKIGLNVVNFMNQIKHAGEYIQTWFVDGFTSVYNQVMNAFNLTKEFFGWVSEKAEPVGRILGRFLPNMPVGGNDVAAGTGGATGQAAILAAAKDFATGAPGKSKADIWAKSGAIQDGVSVRQMYINGVACAISTEKVLNDAGATKAVLNAMTPSVPQTYKNLLAQGLAEVVPASQLQGGELFFSPGKTHTGIVGEGGRTLLHAANSQGSKIGMGQRFSSTSNYLGGTGTYLRIKPQHMQGAGGAQKPAVQLTVNQDLRGNATPRATGNAAKQGASVLETQMEKMARFTSPLGISP